MTTNIAEKIDPKYYRCPYASRMVATRVRLVKHRQRPKWLRWLMGGALTETILAVLADDAEYEFLRHEQDNA